MERDKIQKAGHKIIAVVGNREGWGMFDVLHKTEKTNMITKGDMIVSGGSYGVDMFAQVYARKKGIPILIIYPDLDKPSPERYYERNRKIAEISDEVIAFNKNSRFSGTLNTITEAKKLGKMVKIFKK